MGDRSNRLHFPEKRGLPGIRRAIRERRWVLLWRHIGPYPYRSRDLTPVELADQIRGFTGTPKPGRTSGNHLPSRELDRDGSAGSRYRPLSMEVPSLRRRVGRETRCHLIVMLVLLDGAKLGPPRFPALSLFAQRLRLSNVKSLSPFLAESLRCMTRLVNVAMLVDCEIYLSFAGGKAAVRRYILFLFLPLALYA